MEEANREIMQRNMELRAKGGPELQPATFFLFILARSKVAILGG